MFKIDSIWEAEREASERAANRIHQVQGESAAKFRVRGKWLTVTDCNGSYLYQFDGKTVDRNRASYLISTR